MAGNELNYVDYDFDALMLQLINRVKLQSAWIDTYRSGTGQMLIELYAYVANLVLYYIERRAEESYIGTASNRSSVINIVRLLNYQPKRKVGATGTLTFTRNFVHTKNIYIPRYTECQSTTGVKFIVTSDVVLKGSSTYPASVEATAMQGYKEEIEQTSAGGTSQVYNIAYTDIEDSYPLVYVNGVLWEEVDSFIDSVNTSKHYMVRYELDDTVSVLFGDGVFGLAPSAGDVIKFIVIHTEGLEGNVYEEGKVTTLNSTLYDSDGAVVSNISVTNASSDPSALHLFLGGDDAQDAEEIRNEAPRVFATGDRAVTRSDFMALIDNYAGVANCNVWGENEEDPPNYDMFNQLKIVIILQNWALPDENFKDEITDYLYDYSMMTVRYSYVDADILYAYPVVELKVLNGYTLSEVESAVEEAVATYFELGTTAKLGVDKRESDIINLIEEVEGVSYCHMTLKLYKELDAYYSSIYEYGASLNATPIKKESVQIYVNEDLTAVDDGAGGFTDSSSIYSVDGTIDYTTGELRINFSPDLDSGDIVSAVYEQDEDGDIIVDRHQIVNLEEVHFTDVSYDTSLEG